ncbi:MAG TPA: hypothetical protein VI636_11385 [Candidatus Angelobacter sp.]
MKFLVKCQFVLASALLIVLAGCNQSPQEIKQKTAKATREVKQDVKAVADGVREGLDKNKKEDNGSKK